MFVRVWEYEVPLDRTAAFTTAYAPDGPWGELFRRAGGFLGTELYRDSGRPGRYLTIDRWQSEAAFVSAKAALADDYAALDRCCEAYTSEESWLGLHDIVH